MEEKDNDIGPEEETNRLDTATKGEEGDSKNATDLCPENHQVPSQKQEEEVMKKKYGGLLPKKHPLISKDHERAFFDSADWALGKVGAQKSKGPLEALRPKLQPTPHQHARSRSAYSNTPADGGEDGFNFDDLNPNEHQDSALDSSIDQSHMENQNLPN